MAPIEYCTMALENPNQSDALHQEGDWPSGSPGAGSEPSTSDSPGTSTAPVPSTNIRSVFIPYDDPSSADNGRGPSMRVLRGKPPGPPAPRPRFSVPLDGRHEYSVRSMCAAIDGSESLQNAQIVEAECLRQWTHGVLHRFIILRISRFGEDDVWLRIDRRAGKGVVQRMGRTEANDQARLARSRSSVFDPKESKFVTETQVYFEPRQPVINEADETDQLRRPAYSGCPTLKQLSIFLKVVQDELTLYDVVRENCWFLASLILDFLLKLPLPNCRTTIVGTTRNNSIAPALRSRIKVRYLVKEGAESLSLTMEEWLVLNLLTQTPPQRLIEDARKDTNIESQLSRWTRRALRVPASSREVSLSVVLGARVGKFLKTSLNHIFRPPANEFELALLAAEQRYTLPSQTLQTAFHESTLPALREATNQGSIKHRHTLALLLPNYADALFRDSQLEPLKEAVEHQKVLVREGLADIAELAEALRRYAHIETLTYNPHWAIAPLLESKELLRGALQIEQNAYSLSVSLFHTLWELGGAYTENLQYAQAHEVYAEMLDLGCQLSAAVPFAFANVRHWRRSVYACINSSRGKVSNVVWGTTVDATVSLNRCLISCGLSGEESDLADVLELQGEAFSLRRDPANLERAFTEAVKIRKLAGDGDPHSSVQLVACLRQYAESLVRVDLPSRAVQQLTLAMAIFRMNTPSMQSMQSEWALSLTLFAQIAENDGRYEAALRGRQSAVEAWRKCPWQDERLALALCALAQTLHHMNRSAETLDLLEESVGLLRSQPWDVHETPELHNVFEVRASVLEKLGRTVEARAVRDEKAAAEAGGCEYQEWLKEYTGNEPASHAGIAFDEYGVHITGMRLITD